MAFHDVQFPADISFGAVGGAEFKTSIVTLDSGHERRNIDWSIARGEWDVVHGLEDQADIDVLSAFFRAREGRAHWFRFKDWSDFELARQNIGTTDGSTATYQIFKRYTSLVDYDRVIAKPVSGTVQAWVNNVAIGEGAGSSQFKRLAPATISSRLKSECCRIPIRFFTPISTTRTVNGWMGGNPAVAVTAAMIIASSAWPMPGAFMG